MGHNCTEQNCPFCVLDDYNNGSGPYAHRTVLQWTLILGYLIKEYELAKLARTTDDIAAIANAIIDVDRFMRGDGPGAGSWIQ